MKRLVMEKGFIGIVGKVSKSPLIKLEKYIFKLLGWHRKGRGMRRKLQVSDAELRPHFIVLIVLTLALFGDCSGGFDF